MILIQKNEFEFVPIHALRGENSFDVQVNFSFFSLEKERENEFDAS